MRKYRRIGRRGLSLARDKIFRRCADCRRMAKLTGFLCKICYGRRNNLYYYRMDKNYHRKAILRSRRNRERKKNKL
jgi:23S rRNA U2552 (ribose-2'-O)-methylase RlmE/FtsJ